MGEARTARATGGLASRAVRAGPFCAGGRRGVELGERALHLCVLPGPLRRPPPEPGWVSPNLSPGWAAAGGRARPGPGARNSRLPRALSGLT